MKNKFIIIILLSLFMASSCTKDFDEINTNPVVAEEVAPDYLFPNSVLNTVRLLGDMEYEAGWTYGMYWTESGGAFVNFGTVDITLQDWWRRFYINCLTNLSKIDELYKDDPNYTNRVIIAKIWESYIYSQMVSYWGPVPFSQAINEDITSGYDSEETIYHTLISRLLTYSDTLDATKDKYDSKADLIYGGNIAKWKKFANSLALKLSMQIYAKDKTFTEPVISQLLANENELISSNDDNATFKWYKGSLQWNPLYQKFVYSPVDRKVNVSEFLLMYMQPYGDPRMQLYAEPAAVNGQYTGRPINKARTPEGLNIPLNPHSGKAENDYSKPGDMWFQEDGFYTILTYAEICFLKSEGAFLRLSDKSAQTYYYAGIDASLEALGKANKAADYKATNGIRWASYGAGVADWIGQRLGAGEYLRSSEIKSPYKQIMVQYWLALYPKGLEAWTLFRRTGMIELPVMFSTDPSNTEVPVDAPLPERFKYPNEEKVYNTAGYNEGVSDLGNDDLMYTPLYFSIKKH